ncbi:hypothetical protein C8R46DRAFT_1196619 [Mycena filopes]|nr:hypothetical protein C8R46DRAFT_1196619 [Mycena filopes]
MFFSASIAVVSILSLSYTAVHSAPVRPRTVVQQACTGINGTGVCTPLNTGDACTNTPGLQSLILNPDADCFAFPLPNCDFDVHDSQLHPVREQFSDDSFDLSGKGIQSVQCPEVEGTVNGFTAGSAEDVEQEKADKAAGIAV